MSMNIKSERAHELARRAAAATGKSQTRVVEDALARYVEQLEATDSAGEQRVWRILAAVDARLSDSDRAALRHDDLYDDAGLPA